MDKNAFVTPVKTFTRLHLTPTTKTCLCILCGEAIQDARYRLKLFHKDTKTSHCLLLEKFLQVTVFQNYFADHICRNCARKLTSLENKVTELKDKFNNTLKNLESSHGKKTKKRLLPEDESTSKKSLFLSLPTTSTDTPKTECDMATPCGFNKDIIDSLIKNDYQIAVSELMKKREVKDYILKALVQETQNDLKTLCKKDSLSILRGQNKQLLVSFDLKTLSDELQSKLPSLWCFLQGCVSNPTQEFNKLKKGKSLIPQLLSASASLIHIYNRDMNIIQCLNSLVMLKGGCKKSAFSRLNATGNCLSYWSTLDMADRLASDWEKPLLEWKSEMELSVAIEEAITQQIETLDETIDMLSDTSMLSEVLFIELEQLQCSLKEHKSGMHPGYYFIGDNVDMRTQVRQMTLKNQTKDHHMYNICCYLNRVSGNHLDNTRAKGDINTVPFANFLPSNEHHKKLIDEFAFLVAHEWCKRILWLRSFKASLPVYIHHPYMKEMRNKTQRVNMGVLLKNEQYNDQMVDICQFLHQHVPRHDADEEQSTLNPVKVLSGGDYLTFERHKSAQSSMANGRTPSSRLEGLVPKMEEFHNQAELLKVIWKVLYSTKSSKEIGTLYASRNSINARNVTDEPSDNFYAATELLNKFDSAYITCGALHHFGMESPDADPTANQYTGEIGDKKQMSDFVLTQAKLFLESNLKIDTPVIPTFGLQNNSLFCRFCNKKYMKKKLLRKHEASVHRLLDPLFTSTDSTVTPSQPQTHKEDGVLNYTQAALLLGLLRLNHTDAIKMGDGQRIMDINMYLYLLYKTNNCPKYAYGILETLAQSKVLLSERLAHQLIWNRTVNHRGKSDTNHPNDLDIEHQNKLFKDEIHSYRGAFTEKSISRVSRSATVIDKILKAYDRSVNVFRPSGDHTSINTDEDIQALVKQLQQGRVFDFVPGRNHSHFENINSNPFQNLDGDQLRDWISSCLKKYSQEHFYH